MDHARLIDHPAAAGDWNMAVDQFLLETTRDTGQPVLRFYRWNPATLSLGYFQMTAERQAHEPSRNCAMVRRATGGGAILHDRELTYSLCISGRDPLARARLELYAKVHRAVIAALAEWNIRAELFEGNERASETRQAAFLCFQRRTRGDIVLKGSKIVGSAQRRDHDAILQHGSIVLARSEYAPELAGIRDLCGQDVADADLSIALVRQLERTLTWTFEPAQLSDREQLACLEIRQKQFGRMEWNDRR